MDNDLISRQAAIEKAETAAEFWSNADDFAEGVHAGYLLAANLIKALPSAERRGRWVDLKCDQCGQVDMSKPNYCPNCGARMEEGQACARRHEEDEGEDE